MEIKLIILDGLVLIPHIFILSQTGSVILVFPVGAGHATLEPRGLEVINGGVIFMFHEQVDQIIRFLGIVQVQRVLDGYLHPLP